MDEQAVLDEDQIETEEIVEEADEQAPVESHDDTEDEMIVSIGEESPPPEEHAQAPEWVRELRRTSREDKRRIRDLEARLTTQTENKPVMLGAKPKLEDHEYDTDRYEAALADWFERKRRADESEAKAQAEVMTQQREWQGKLEAYSKARADLKVRDFEDAEDTIQGMFSVTQQGVVLQGADNPALVVYALGKNPSKAKELSAIKDPVKFAFAVAKLEKDLKVTNRKAATAPEKIVSGTGRSSGAVDSTLERLREEAARTGNMTKVLQYKQQKRAAK